MTVSDEFLRRTRDPVLLARAARIFRAARARRDAIDSRTCPTCRAEPGQDCHPVGSFIKIGDYPGRPFHTERDRN